MGCSVPLLPLTLPPPKQGSKDVSDNPPCLPSALLHGACELFKSKLQNLAEAATIVQRSELGLCVFQIQQIGREAKPRQIATGNVTQLESQTLQWQRQLSLIILDEIFPTLPMTPPISCNPQHQCCPTLLHLSNAILMPLGRGQL